MLVLSRKLHEKLLFPGFQTAIEVVAIKAGVVRLGIEAPAEVKVIRAEIHDPKTADVPGALSVGLPRELVHQFRNRLNGATLALALLRKQQELGMHQEAGATTERLDQEMQSLRELLGGLEQPAPVPPPAAPKRRRKALLVEDDTNERELLAGFLRLAGLDVDTAGDGVEAMDRLHARQPDVVLLDMVLPRCDGPATVREIRRDPACAGLKVFAVSGHAPERFATGDGAAGVNRWFRKPINPEELLRELDLELAGMS